MLLGQAHGLTAVRNFQYDGFALQPFQNVVQRLANQCMIVDNKNLMQGLRHSPLHGDSTHLRVVGETCVPKL